MAMLIGLTWDRIKVVLVTILLIGAWLYPVAALSLVLGGAVLQGSIDTPITPATSTSHGTRRSLAPPQVPPTRVNLRS